jgi:signal transduction histidine kinase
VIALPWFAMGWQKYPKLLDYMFVNQQLTRYTASTYNNPQPWWFYLVSLLLLLFPWVFFAFAQQRRQASSLPAVAPPVDKAWMALCWIWVVSIVVFFSIPNSKLIGYVLPVLPALACLAGVGWQRSMAHRPFAPKLFVLLCLLNAGIALAIVTQVGGVTRSGRAQDLAEVLACEAQPSDTVYVSGAYPYDLPFYAQLRKPMVVLDNWPLLRREAGDGWQRELFEGADFDPQAAAQLQPLEALTAAGRTPGNWLVRRIGDETVLDKNDWRLFFEGAGWRLYQSAGRSTAEGPKPAQQIGLPGCKDQRHKQGR